MRRRRAGPACSGSSVWAYAFINSLPQCDATLESLECSEKALQYMPEVDFKGCLVAGVPPGALVAHKFDLPGGPGHFLIDRKSRPVIRNFLLY